MIESLFLVTLLSLLMAGLGALTLAQLARAQKASTYAAMRTVERAVLDWQEQTGGRCPPSLEALSRAGLLSREPRDGWRRPLRVARCSRAGIALYSLGKDGRPHTQDDLLSWAAKDERWVTASPAAPRRWGSALAVLAGLVLLGAMRRRLPLRFTLAPAAG